MLTISGCVVWMSAGGTTVVPCGFCQFGARGWTWWGASGELPVPLGLSTPASHAGTDPTLQEGAWQQRQGFPGWAGPAVCLFLCCGTRGTALSSRWELTQASQCAWNEETLQGSMAECAAEVWLAPSLTPNLGKLSRDAWLNWALRHPGLPGARLDLSHVVVIVVCWFFLTHYKFKTMLHRSC